jgi:GTP-binding protein
VPRAVTDAWAPMIEAYLKGSRQLAAVVVLLDSRRTPDERDVRLIEWLNEYHIPALYALTKSDKLNRQEMDRARRAVSDQLGLDEPLLFTSAKTGVGVKELWGEIQRCLSQEA